MDETIYVVEDDDDEEGEGEVKVGNGASKNGLDALTLRRRSRNSQKCCLSEVIDKDALHNDSGVLTPQFLGDSVVLISPHVSE